MLFFKRSFLLISFFFFSFQAFSHGSHDHHHSHEDHHSHHSNKEIEASLEIFEKAFVLSSEFLEKEKESQMIPLYRVNGKNIYLNDRVWDLVKAWLIVYLDELEKHCHCDLDPNLLIQEAKNYLPQNFFERKIRKIAREMKEFGKNISYITAFLIATYGYTAAIAKAAAEVAETIVFVIGLGMFAHAVCNAIDVMIFPLVRQIQKYTRVFVYGGRLDSGRLWSSAKMFWISRQIYKSRRRVFFHIEQALEFKHHEMENGETGGKSKSRALLWLRELKRKTDPLFEQIEIWEREMEQESENSVRSRTLMKKIKKARRKIENLSKINRKDFFGMRYKRYLLLKSRKGKKTYMSGEESNQLLNKMFGGMFGGNILWPSYLRKIVMEKYLKSPDELLQKKDTESSDVLLFPHSSDEFLQKNIMEIPDKPLQSVEMRPDEIREGLVEEFLKGKDNLKNGGQGVQLLMHNVEEVFNTDRPRTHRLMDANSIQAVLGTVFFINLQLLSPSILAKQLSEKYNLSFRQKMKIQYRFGLFLREIYRFADFLSVVSLIKDERKIQFYKYESMEKMLAILDFFYEVNSLLNDKRDRLDIQELFEILNTKYQKIRSFSLSRRKKKAFSILPVPQCKKLVERQ